MNRFFILLFSLSFSVALAQTGTIRGTIKDAVTKEDIIGATIRIDGTSLGAATDINGFFTINKAPVDKVKLIISYVSYKTKTIPDVTVEDGKVTEVNTFIEEDKVALQEVKIVGQRLTNTEVSVISEIKAAQMVVNGISSQQIGKSLDRDAAQVVKRVPGVTIFGDKFINIRGLNQRYNTVMLHNAFTPSMETDVRSFSFDIIPSSQIDRLLVFKSPSAELPGEFAGGVVKIFTKSIPDETGITVDVNASYREGTTGKKFLETPGVNLTGFNDGYLDLSKYFPKTRDELIASNPDRLTQIGQLLKNDWTPVQSTALPDMRVGITGAFKLIDRNDLKIATISAINYSNTYTYFQMVRRDFGQRSTQGENRIFDFLDNQYTHNIRVGIMHNWALRLNENHTIEFKNLYNQIYTGQYVNRTGFDANNGYNANNHSFDQVYRGIYTGQLVGTHKLGSDKTKVDWVIGYNSSFRDQPDYRRYRSDVDLTTGSKSIYVPVGAAQAFFLGRTYLTLDEKGYTGSANFTQKLTGKGDKEIELKAGLFYEYKDRSFSARNLGYVKANSSLFDLDITQSALNLFAKGNINSTNGLKIDEQTNASDSYTASNNLFAGYAQVNLPLSKKLNVIAGVRAENNTQKLQSALIDKTPVNYNRNILSLLPSVNLTYNFTDRSLLRLAYGRTVNRPEFREIAPFSFYDFVNNRVVSGNPQLSIAKVDNFDFRYEFYPTPSEIVSVAAFHKNFSDPIEVIFTGGANTTLNINFNNAKSATSTGLEFEVRKNLASISPAKLLQKLSINFNAAFIYSRVKLQDKDADTQSDNRPLQGQSPYIINGGLTYSNPKKDFQLNVLYNIIGKRIYAVGAVFGQGAIYPDWYEMPRNVIDITFSKGINQHFFIKGGITDLLNQQNIILQDGNADGNYNKSSDQIIQSYSPGRQFSLGITYKLLKK
ncbi:MAG: TonB-dependent receptor [Spirosomataceae bacterium]